MKRRVEFLLPDNHGFFDDIWTCRSVQRYFRRK